MDRRLLTLAVAQDGVFSIGEAATVGVTGNDLTRMVRGGELVRFRRGAYALADVLAGADLAGRYRLRVLAVMRTRPRTDRASHHSSLALLGVAFTGVPLDTVFAESRTSGRRSTNGLRLGAPTAAVGLRAGDVRLVGAGVACVQVADGFGFEAGLCAMDSALHRRRCTLDELRLAVEQLHPRRRASALLAIGATDPLAESVGETRTRIILRDAGFSVRSQVVIQDGSRFLGRVDLLVDDCVVVEFDGRVKYEGVSGRAALTAEKERESRISRLGYEVVRVVWAELSDPAALVRRVMDARRVATARRAAMAG
jgi:very-short-patch-repair endonuclease